MKDLHAVWKHRWFTPKAKYYNSTVHGVGLIATKIIRKGEAVAVLGGIVIPVSEIEKYQKRMGHIGIQIDDEFFIGPSAREEVSKNGAINHSCEPNTGYSNSLVLVAMRDIKPGEEIVFDYAFSETVFRSFACRCGSKNCRKTITQNDWRRKDLQEKYGQYFSPFLRRKFME